MDILSDVLALLRRIMNWHATRDDDFESPIVRGMARRTAEQRERDRVLSDDELRAVWKADETFAQPLGQFVRFLLPTSSNATFEYPLFSFEAISSVWPSGETDETENRTSPACGVRFSNWPVATSTR